MKTKPRSRQGAHRVIKFGVGLWLAGVLLCLVWAGCSVENNYKTLSFFFDGVPNPEATAKADAAGGITADIRKSPTFSIHKPFADDACNSCHSDRFQLTNQDSSLCMKCHADRPTQYPRMHGPVAAVACLWCHSPHESAEAHLLKKPARQLCAQCHDQTMLNVESVPAHADTTRSCLECHDGHGGNAAFFLREGWSQAPTPAGPRESSPK